MFVTPSLREQVGRSLSVLDERARWLEHAALADDHQWSDPAFSWAAERALHVAMECATDAANAVIDALVMREPGGYADILKVLVEEGVLNQAWFSAFEPALQFRDRLVRGYVDLDPLSVRTAVRQYAPLFRPCSTAIRDYLELA